MSALWTRHFLSHRRKRVFDFLRLNDVVQVLSVPLICNVIASVAAWLLRPDSQRVLIAPLTNWQASRSIQKRWLAVIPLAAVRRIEGCLTGEMKRHQSSCMPACSCTVAETACGHPDASSPPLTGRTPLLDRVVVVVRSCWGGHAASTDSYLLNHAIHEGDNTLASHQRTAAIVAHLVDYQPM